MEFIPIILALGCFALVAIVALVITVNWITEGGGRWLLWPAVILSVLALFGH